LLLGIFEIPAWWKEKSSNGSSVKGSKRGSARERNKDAAGTREEEKRHIGIKGGGSVIGGDVGGMTSTDNSI